MQFGSLTVEQWDLQLSLPGSTPPSSPQTHSAPELIALTSTTTPPSSPSNPVKPTKQRRTPSPTPDSLPTTTPAPAHPHPSQPTDHASSQSSASSRQSSPSPSTIPSSTPPQPLTWAARVASGGAGVAIAAQNLPIPRRIGHGQTMSPSPSVPIAPQAHAKPPASSTVPLAATHPPPRPVAHQNNTTPLSQPAKQPPQTSVKAHSPPRRKRRPQVSLPSRRLRGLVNGGNCCFINVVLQALLACDAFRHLLHECEDAPMDSLVRKFVRLVQEMDGDHAQVQPNGTDQLATASNPRTMKDGAWVKEEALLADWFYDVFPSSGGVGSLADRAAANGCAIGNGGSAGGSQEDAEEFLNFVLNSLHEELVEWEGTGNHDATASYGERDDSQFHTIDGRIHTMNGSGGALNGGEVDVWTEMTRSGKSVEIRGGEFAQSGLTDIFGGALRSEVRRTRMKPSVTREPFFSLSLDIESGMIRDVEHALSAYFEPEFLEGYTLEDGNGGQGLAVDAKKQVLLMQMPQVLILHLKRFSHNSVTGALNKVSRHMMFPEVLRVPGKVMHCAGNRWGVDGGKAYELMAVVTHVGKELAGGHYTCDVRWEGDDGERVWFTCDDSKVVRTNLQKVCRKQAYLLFYSAVPSE